MTKLGPHGHLDVLGSIPVEYRQAILEQCAKRRYKKGEVVWHQGDPADHVGFLIQGKAISTYASPNAKIGVTGFWSAGDILGAADLGTSNVRQMTVRCLADSVVFTLAVGRFFEISRRFPEVAQAVIKALSIRLRWVAHLALTLETQNTFGRLCFTLLALCDTFPREHEEGVLIDVSVTNELLAAIVGVSRQFANITLHELQSGGLIKLKNRKIIVLDREGLLQVASQNSRDGSNLQLRPN